MRLTDSSTSASVSVGGDHVCAVTASGELWCLGANDRGQLGSTPTIEDVQTPTRVNSGLSDLQGVACGGAYTDHSADGISRKIQADSGDRSSGDTVPNY